MLHGLLIGLGIALGWELMKVARPHVFQRKVGSGIVRAVLWCMAAFAAWWIYMLIDAYQRGWFH